MQGAVIQNSFLPMPFSFICSLFPHWIAQNNFSVQLHHVLWWNAVERTEIGLISTVSFEKSQIFHAFKRGCTLPTMKHRESKFLNSEMMHELDKDPPHHSPWGHCLGKTYLEIFFNMNLKKKHKKHGNIPGHSLFGIPEAWISQVPWGMLTIWKKNY